MTKLWAPLSNGDMLPKLGWGLLSKIHIKFHVNKLIQAPALRWMTVWSLWKFISGKSDAVQT